MTSTTGRRAWALLLAVAVSGCAAPQVGEFAAVKPVFQPEQYFAGRAVAWGVLEDGSGNPTKRFTSVDEGTLSGDTVTIAQTISYSDGTSQSRSWKLRRVDTSHYEGTADDIVGVARGEAAGNTLHLDYDLALSPDNPLTHVHLNQWLYLQEGGDNMLSRTTITKLGIVVARSSEYVHRETATAAK
ncbi:MAG: DUF3833 family protein [Nevskia sp.]|nr:DUF3833 family protein [Nevskia sp.]